jgi:uncharacterized coiled-coil DUF342 family protein
MAEYFTKEGDEFKKVDSFTEEQIDEIAGDVPWLTKRLDRARENERSKFADYDDLKSKATDLETKLTATSTEKDELAKQLGQTKLEVDKVKIINEFGLKDDMAEFVIGENADEMRKRAEKLANGIKPTGVHIDKKDKPDEKKSDNKRIAGELFGRKKA